MSCKVCGASLFPAAGFSRKCIVPFNAPSGREQTHYSIVDNGDSRHGFKVREHFVLHDLQLVNMEFLDGRKILSVIYLNSIPGNMKTLFEIPTNVQVEDLLNLTIDELHDKLKMYQLMS